MEQQTPVIPITPPTPTQPEPQNSSNSYIGVGIIIGIILSLAVAAGIYYKVKTDLISSLKTQTQEKTIAQQTEEQKMSQSTQEVAEITPQPTVTPVTIATKQDLITQQSALDDSDMSSISAALDQNAQDAAQFAQ